MNVIIGQSATEIWSSDRIPNNFSYSINCPDLANLPEDFYNDFHKNPTISGEIASTLCIQFPVYLAVPHKKYRWNGKHFIYRACTKQFPDNSFCSLLVGAHTIFIARPELCFLQSARHCDFIDLVLLGYDFCATYVVSESSQFGQINRDPLTTAVSLRNYIRSAKNLRGQQKALGALNYILDNSNSPMESRIALVMILPIENGGYGMKKPLLNFKLKLKSEAVELVNQSTIRGDFLWSEEKIIIEYNSNIAHNTSEANTKDANRQLAFQSIGYRSFSLTSNHFNNINSLDKFIFMLRKEMNYENESALFSKYKNKRKELLNRLFKQNYDFPEYRGDKNP